MFGKVYSVENSLDITLGLLFHVDIKGSPGKNSSLQQLEYALRILHSL